MSSHNKNLPDAHDHTMDSSLFQKPVRVTVVGCGGTGSAVAAGLPLLHQGMKALGHPYGLHVTFVDGDRISEVNCVRQPFSISEIGLYKATVLATRINMFWGLAWEGSPYFVDESWSEHTDIIISCVDTRKARKSILNSAAYWDCRYWLDLGNNADNGQFILGQPWNFHWQHTDCSMRLPTVAELFPEIVNSRLDENDPMPACSAMEALERQEIFVNQTLAYQSLAMLARLFRHGRISYHGGFVNLASGKTSSLPVDPSVWRRVMQQNQPKKVIGAA